MAVIGITTALVTAVVVMSAIVTEVAPSGTTTPSGMTNKPASLVGTAIVTACPPVGAAELIVIVALTTVPPTAVVGENVNDVNVGVWVAFARKTAAEAGKSPADARFTLPSPRIKQANSGARSAQIEDGPVDIPDMLFVYLMFGKPDFLSRCGNDVG